MNKNYSLWIMPRSDELREVINTLSHEQNSASFSPHAGIISIIEEPLDSVVLKLEPILSKIKPFSITLDKLTHFDENPGGVYFLLKQDENLINFRDILNKSIKHSEKKYIIPIHSTITYALTHLKEKEAIIKKYSYLEGLNYLVDALYLVDSSGSSPSKWKVIKKIKFGSN